MFNIDKVDRNIEFFVFDVFVAIQKIRKVTGDFNNPQDLLYNFTSWDSVIREFEIIGEASKYLLKQELLTKDYQVVVDFRNHITHEYFGVDSNIVWATINIDLGPYESIIIKIIHDIKPDLKQELIESFIEDNNYLDFVVKALEELKDAK